MKCGPTSVARPTVDSAFSVCCSLMLACYAGHLDVVKYLRKHGASWDARDLGGCTALHWAADGGHCPVIDWMIKDGCEVWPPCFLVNPTTLLRTWNHLLGSGGRQATRLAWLLNLRKVKTGVFSSWAWKALEDPWGTLVTARLHLICVCAAALSPQSLLVSVQLVAEALLNICYMLGMQSVHRSSSFQS